MNADWNTPPNGDFVRYVDRLTAQAVAGLRQGQKDVAEYGLDVGMAPSSSGPGGVLSTPSPREASAAGRKTPGTAGGGPFGAFTKPLLGAGAVILAILWAAGAPAFVLVMVAVAAFWIASKLRTLALPGPAKWQQALEEANRRARENQQGKASK